MTAAADPSLQALLDAGLAAHVGGRPAEARALYEAVLARAPDHFDALHMLGVVEVQLGEPARGAALIERAIRIDPKVATANVNLAMALGALGRHAAALASADRAVALDGLIPEAHENRGNALLGLGRAAEAIAAYDQTLALRPAEPHALYNRANALRDLGRLDDAVAAYDATIAVFPNYVEAISNRGAVLAELGRLDEALAAFDAVLALRPTAEVHRNRGAVLARQRRLVEAVTAYDAALAADPASAQAHSDRASVLNDLGRTAEALAAADRAIALKPRLADAHNNRGIALFTQRRTAEARACYERALAIDPDAPEPHINRALSRLLAGDLAGGFEEYRWRWRATGARHHRPRIDCPDWEGEPLAGKRLLVFAEQGFGDTLQFVRFVPRLASLGAQLTLLVEPPLKRLLAASLPDMEVMDQLPADAAFDAQAAMLCLPRLTGVTEATVPAATPYLAVDPTAAAGWASRLATLPGRRVGLVWAGAARREHPANAAIDARRSLRLAQLAPLAAADVQFVSLQIGEPAAEAAPPGLGLVDWTAEIGDFADTAALVAGLDLVITVDTSVAHLAGALGRPVWILSRFDGCWRWLEDRDDSPWYPTARIFRQPAPGVWDAVIASVAAALAG
ncbi:MAG TPA: tetratricopeptide repeat protein [Caulobacteraceae bacterium]|nr:tetratricopeptide repeat protein [Caulobacteraceae bacterium]